MGAIWVLVLLFLSIFYVIDISFDLVVERASGTTLYVNTTGSGGAYTSIQDAINAANPGDTVFVYEGTYYENILVNKTISLLGEDRNTSVIDGGTIKDVINISIDWVNISSFNVIGGKNGVKLYSVQNCSVNNTNISNNDNGFYLFSSNENEISGNNIHDNSECAIYLYDSNNNYIADTYVSNNQKSIYLFSSDENNITNNIINYSGYAIHLLFSSKNDLYNNNISNASRAIFLDSSLYNNISYNNLSSNGQGIYFKSSHFNNITNNDINSNSGEGIYLSGNGNYIVDNIISYNYNNGIHIDWSTGNKIENNIISNNVQGILLSSCSSNTLENNAMINNGVFIIGNFLYQFNRHNIDTTNTVNGRPVYYWKNETTGEIPSDAGQVIIVNSTNIIIKNLELANSYVGIQLGYSSNNYILENNVSNNLYGIYLIYSNANDITNNTVSLNYRTGIYAGFTTRNNITGNNIYSNNGNGLDIQESQGIFIADNTIYENWNGLALSHSNENNITNNNLSLNYNNGISIYSSWKNNITSNDIFSNQNYGINIQSSQYNQIYHNNIINNINQKYDDESNNSWDNSYPEGGNYWSDYSGSDEFKGPNQDQSGSDGIGDTKYVIDTDSWDNYPLMKPFDTLPPFIQLLFPANNSVFQAGPFIDFYVYDDFLYLVNYSLNGGPNLTLSDPFDISTAEWPEGNYTVQINALDLAGNANSSLYNFIIDNPPLIILNSPANNSIILPGTILDFDIIDANLAQTNYSVNGGPNISLPTPFDMTTIGWPDGDYTIQIDALDLPGNFISLWFYIIIDSTKPDILLNSPLNNSIIPGGTMFNFSIIDSNLLQANYSVNGEPDIPLPSPFDISTSGWTDGNCTVQINALDKVGNLNPSWFKFIIDSSFPTISFNPGLNHSIIPAGRVIRFNISDSNLDSVMFSNDEGEYIVIDVPYTIDTSDWTDDLHTLYIKAKDSAGNERIYWFEVTIDGTPPYVVTTYPLNYATDVDTNISISITFSEPMNQSLTEDYLTISPAIDFIYSWNENGLVLTITFTPNELSEETTYTLSIDGLISDVSGNAMESDFEMSFTTKTYPEPEKPSPEPTFPYWIIGITAVTIAIALLLFFMFWRKRKGEPTVEEETDVEFEEVEIGEVVPSESENQ